MADRIRIALKSTEGSVQSYAETQSRLLEISNRNGRAIEQSQELYVASAASMKELGYSAGQTIDFIETLSNNFTINATSVQKTDSAINALSKAMAIGRIDSEAFQSILAATPTVVDDLSKHLNKTGNEVKKLGLSGKISIEEFTNAMIAAREPSTKLANSMQNTILDGVTKASNSFKALIGEANQTYGIDI